MADRHPTAFTSMARGAPQAAPSMPAVLVMPAIIEKRPGGNHSWTSFRQPMNENADPAPIRSRTAKASPAVWT